MLCTDPRFVYQVAYVIFTVLGNLIHPFFFAFHLVDLILRYEELRIVLRSVTRPAKALVLTAIVFLAAEYWYALFGFAFIRSDFERQSEDTFALRNECNTLFSCFLVVVDQGFKNDGGIGGYLKQLNYEEAPATHFYGRLAYDSVFNLILLTILLNVTAGLIINTFSTLRDETEQKLEDMTNKCTVCGLDRCVLRPPAPRRPRR